MDPIEPSQQVKKDVQEHTDSQTDAQIAPAWLPPGRANPGKHQHDRQNKEKAVCECPVKAVCVGAGYRRDRNRYIIHIGQHRSQDDPQ
jgi:hypothetical protein